MSINNSVHELKEYLKEHTSLADSITESLKKAKIIGESELNNDLYQALRWWPNGQGSGKDTHDVGWPEDIDTYLSFLDYFVRWMPRQSTDKAWTDPDTDEQQEVYDRLCHFYWLIDQKVDAGKKIVQKR